jgi:hypothetical protein
MTLLELTVHLSSKRVPPEKGSEANDMVSEEFRIELLKFFGAFSDSAFEPPSRLF